MRWLDDITSQPSNFRTRSWIEINYESKKYIVPVVKLNLKIQW